MKNLFLEIIVCSLCLAFTGVLCAQDANTSDKPIELKITHHGPTNWPQHAEVLAPWAKKIEQATSGKVKCTFYVNETLGKASEQYDLVVKGTADISSSITEYTPGRFPFSSVMKLPFLGANSAEASSLVFWRLYRDYLKDSEFKDVKVLWLFCHGPGSLHTINKEIKTLEDLKGLRIRVGDSVLAKSLELLGAAPVVCSVTDGYKLMKAGKLDGTALTWEGISTYKYMEFCKYHTEINLYTLPFFVVMNKSKYESFPADIRKAIDENSGESMAALAGRVMDNADASARKAAQERGDIIYSLPKSELARWKNITMPVGDEWVRSMEAKGLPGREVLLHTNEALIYVNGLFKDMQSKPLDQNAIELKISHMGPANWIPLTQALKTWAKRIEERSGGTVKFRFFDVQVLGKASEQYDLVVRGDADISCSITEYTPGRFPLTSVMKLPFLGESGEKASIVLWHSYQQYLKDEFKDTKMLWMFCHGQGHLHTVSKPVKTLEDLKGLRIRVGDIVLAQALERLGAIPVISTINEGYALIKEGKADGTILPWDGFYSFKFHELCKCHTLINMYTLPFFVTMNKEKYAGLPADIRKIIDENSGEQMAALTGRAMDIEDAKIKKLIEDRGDFIYYLSASELEKWRKATVPVGDEWVEKMKAKGLPGQEVLAYVIDLFIQIQK